MTAGKVLNTFQANLKGVVAKIFCSFRSEGASSFGFALGHPKTLGGSFLSYIFPYEALKGDVNSREGANSKLNAKRETYYSERRA